MTSFVTWLQGLVRPIKPFCTVTPWEQGVRVRFGKHVDLLGPGMHWKLPFLDSVTVLPIRVRVASMPTQTAMTRDGKAVSIGLALQYQIEDVERVFRSVHHPEQTLTFWVQGAVGDLIRTLDAGEITPERVRSAVVQQIDAHSMGLGAFQVFVTDLAIVKTYRLLRDDRWVNERGVDEMGREA